MIEKNITALFAKGATTVPGASCLILKKTMPLLVTKVYSITQSKYTVSTNSCDILVKIIFF
jgi:hypothetical protein